MSQSFTVSVIIPVFNRKYCVVDAIESVFAQTHPAFEVIVVDDGSQDGTYEELRSRYERNIKLIRQDNAGVSAARNRGIAEATGDWIAFLDSDDQWFSRKLELQIAVLQRYSGCSEFCFTDSCITGGPAVRKSFFAECGFTPEKNGGIIDDLPERIFAGTEPFFTPSVLVSRRLLTAGGGFDESMILREDTDLFFRLCLLSKCCYVSVVAVTVDRSPNRVVGLCNLYSSRDDRKYESVKRMYDKWLTLPQIQGSIYEKSIRRLLCDAIYNSLENKVRQYRWRAVVREMKRLILLENGVAPVLWKLIVRKVRKVIRKRTRIAS